MRAARPARTTGGEERGDRLGRGDLALVLFGSLFFFGFAMGLGGGWAMALLVVGAIVLALASLRWGADSRDRFDRPQPSRMPRRRRSRAEEGEGPSDDRLSDPIPDGSPNVIPFPAVPLPRGNGSSRARRPE